MRALLFFLPVALLAQTATTQTSTAPRHAAASHAAAAKTTAKPDAGPALTTDDEKTAYAIGLFAYSRMLAELDLSPAELKIVERAMSDAAANKPAEKLDASWMPKLQAFATARQQRAAEANRTASANMLTKAAGAPGAQKSESGLVYQEVTPGSGESPKASDTVKVNYRGTLPNGTEFDSSKPGEPASFPLDHVIKCWTEGVQKMKPGGKAILYCPADLAYGEKGAGPIPPGSALKFEVELLGVTAAPPAPPAPSSPAPQPGTPASQAPEPQANTK